MEGGRSEKRRFERHSTTNKERDASRAEWRLWFRDEFLRAWFVCGVLAWDGVGALQVQYLLDPWYPGQVASPAYVYVAMLAFLILSTVGHVFLYRRWWPSPESRPGNFIVRLATAFAGLKRRLRRLSRLVRRSSVREVKPPRST